MLAPNPILLTNVISFPITQLQNKQVAVTNTIYRNQKRKVESEGPELASTLLSDSKRVSQPGLLLSRVSHP